MTTNPPMMPPDPSTIPHDLDGLAEDEVRELATAYLHLIGLMTTALHECTTGHAYYWWNGHGFQITGHPPDDLVTAIQEAKP